MLRTKGTVHPRRTESASRTTSVRMTGRRTVTATIAFPSKTRVTRTMYCLTQPGLTKYCPTDLCHAKRCPRELGVTKTSSRSPHARCRHRRGAPFPLACKNNDRHHRRWRQCWRARPSSRVDQGAPRVAVAAPAGATPPLTTCALTTWKLPPRAGWRPNQAKQAQRRRRRHRRRCGWPPPARNTCCDRPPV